MVSNEPKGKTHPPSAPEQSGDKPNGIGRPVEKKEELSEADKHMAETLEMLVRRLQEADTNLHRPALEALRTQIRSSAVSVTTVPKALKFLRHHYPTLVTIHEGLQDQDNRAFLADILSVLAMTRAVGGEEQATPPSTESVLQTQRRDTLKYRLVGQQQPIGDWGHEYVRHLAMEIAEESAELSEQERSAEALLPLASDVVNFFLDHNAEPDACDLLYEMGRLSMLPSMLGEGRDYRRVCLYLMSCVPFESDPDDRVALQVAHEIYRAAGDLPNALLVAMRLNPTPALLSQDFEACQDAGLRRQLAFMLARQRISMSTTDEQLCAIFNSASLTDHFRLLAQELEILAPKTPEDIYKSHLQDTLRVVAAPSPRQNLATSFVNALVNAGFGTDTLLTTPEVEAEESRSWIYKTKDHGVLSTVASIGMLHLWNADTGLAKLDRYLYSESVHIKAGAILGIGLVHAGTKNESDPALALLREYLGEGNATVRTAALIGLALAYGGSARQDLAEALLPYVADDNVLVGAMAALALGHVFVGTCDGDVASAILQTMMERDEEQLNHPAARFFGLALALLFLAKSETAAEVILETLQVIEHPIAKDAATLTKICSYAGSGNVLKIQELLRLCTEQGDEEAQQAQAQTQTQTQQQTPQQHPPQTKPTTTATNPSSNPTTNAAGAPMTLASTTAPNTNTTSTKERNYQTFAVIGIALICMMEESGKEMSNRLFSHLMHFGSPSVRKGVPLALGLLYTSHPAVTVMDLLSKYSHDHDKAVAVNAIFAMGLIAAGTNNAKMAQMLRQLAAYYQRDADCLYMVRIAQGLVHAGKGTVTFSPIHSHRLLLNPAAVAGLLSTIVALGDSQALILDNSSYLLYFLTAAIYPRFLITLDADTLKPLPVLVRVGQAVDVVGQAGKPKTITGFQTHTTPVLLAYSERAEFATEEYLPLTPILENFVLVRKNPDWLDETPIIRKGTR